jgi:hypothetical protein
MYVLLPTSVPCLSVDDSQQLTPRLPQVMKYLPLRQQSPLAQVRRANLNLGCTHSLPTWPPSNPADECRMMSDYEVTLVNDNSEKLPRQTPWWCPLGLRACQANGMRSVCLTSSVLRGARPKTRDPRRETRDPKPPPSLTNGRAL